MPTITSASNPLFQEARRAIERGDLTPDGHFVAESLHLLEEAVATRAHIKNVLVNAVGQRKLSQRFPDFRLPVLNLDDDLFARLATTETSQGVLVMARPAAPPKLDQASLVLVLAGVQDPGNAGTLLRAAEAFGVDAALLMKGTVSPFLPKTIRASAGSLFRLPILRQLSFEDASALLTSHGLQPYAATVDGETPVWEANWAAPSAIVVGAEAAGVPEEWSGIAQTVTIPMRGVESLNAGIAGSILLYEASRQRAAQSR